MTHVITQNCVNDASCVPVCPVNCIHPAPGEQGYGTTEMLYIDPKVCIDCGACVSVCPVSAIAPDYELRPEASLFERLNALFYEDEKNADYDPTPVPVTRRQWSRNSDDVLRVAIVGSGPAASYAAEELLAQRGLKVSVDMFERLPTPWGLIRYGVAPDHQSTKAASTGFEKLLRNPSFRIFLNTELGTDITTDDLARRYHAVIFAVGATESRSLGIPGEELKGAHSASNFVAWYNGHPDHAGDSFDLSAERAVIIGNGNVALDVARVLLSDPSRLERTDIADYALEALRESNIREVVLVGRRSAANASFTTPELAGLLHVPGIGVRIDGGTGVPDGAVDSNWPQTNVAYKVQLLEEAAARESSPRMLTFRFLQSPLGIVGSSKIGGIVLVKNELVERDGVERAVATDATETISCGLVFRAIGHRGREIAGLPFDQERGVLPTVESRIVDADSGEPVAGAYAAGWVERGPSGVIGTNKQGSRDTVRRLLDDYEAGLLPAPQDASDLADELPNHLDAAAWKRIDTAERQAGRAGSRPRVKTVGIPDLLGLAADTQQ